ncbi:hypothetical protein [Paracoccus jeotgali]|uniref:hypothetical protein n=1 Tax=Paracoccus jeotgali TaxID=2065379 RepID=UPI0028A9AF9E|nr:hypothetical protein [Paracoccus jeotgali]
MPPLLAGFECGRLHWNGHDLLLTTQHLPGGGDEDGIVAAAASLICHLRLIL